MSESDILPDSWEIRTVESLANVRGGKRIPKGRTLTTLPTPYPYIRVTDMRQGYIDTSALRYVPHDIAPLITPYRIFKGDIFISVAGTLGIVGRIAPELDGSNLTENADRLTSISCDVDYLMYSLRNEPIQNDISAIRTVGAQPKLALRQIKQFRITIPKSRAEQRAIAGVLRDVDEFIATLERLIVKKQAIKQGMMQQLLTGKTRLPGFTGPWQVERAMADVSERISGFWGEDHPTISEGVGAQVIRAGDITTDGRLTSWANRYFSPSQWARAACRDGDVVITASGNGLGKTFYVSRAEHLAASNFVRILRPRSEVSGHFLAYLMQSRPGATALETHTATSAYPNLLPSFFTDPWFALPRLEEQQSIAETLADADVEIDTLRRRIAKTRVIKTGMMQELLTGRTRLPVEEATS